MDFLNSLIEFLKTIWAFLVNHVLVIGLIAAILTILEIIFKPFALLYKKIFKKPAAPGHQVVAELKELVVETSKKLGVAEQVIIAFMNKMGIEDAPLEKWTEILEGIAKDYKRFQEEATLLNPSDPETKKLIQQATELAEQGSLDRARENLQAARERELAAAKCLTEKAQERTATAAKTIALEARFLSTAGQYADAARLYEEAAEIYKPLDAQVRWAYLHLAAVAHSQDGEIKGDNQALLQAIALFQGLLQEVHRQQAPRQWASIQNNLGNALNVLGAREGSIERLEQAVQAYCDALQEINRQQESFEWAAIQNNLGNA
ncbi:MAG: hypothetical protein AB1814_02405 [Thermodesulfobacteriota bacterium]